MKTVKKVYVLIGLIGLSLNLSAQINENQLQRIDSIFSEWNKTNHPGGSIGVMQNGEIVFDKAYGLASLEYSVPNSAGTLYNIASVSKQFTAMGIVLLENQGKLSYDDDIRKYLPYLPEFEETITIRHMLHHISGMRSFHSILGLAGWGGDDTRKSEDIRRIMKYQEALNFTPGERYLYCNNGFIFMADIIKEITGENFVEWTNENIFKPMGMDNSYIEDVYNRVVPNNATSYYKSSDEEFKRAVEYWGYVGSGNMHSNIYDLLKWINNFHSPKKGWEKAFEDLQTRGVLNNGDTITYAFGVHVDKYQDKKRVRHSGSIGGFRAMVCSFPDDKTDIVILTNFSSSSAGTKLKEISDILFDISKPKKTEQKIAKIINLSAKKLEKFSSYYWNNEEDYSRKIYLKNDTLRYKRSEKNESILLPVSSNVFLMNSATSKIKVEFNEIGDKQKSMLIYTGNDTTKLISYEPPQFTDKTLSPYAGKYYSKELITLYVFEIEDNNLLAYHMKHGDLGLKILREDKLEADILGKIKIVRDKQGKILGFYASNSRAKNVWFKKLDVDL